MTIATSGFGSILNDELFQLHPDGAVSVTDATPTAFSNPVSILNNALTRIDYIIECDNGAGNTYIYGAQIWVKQYGGVVSILTTIELGTPPIKDEIGVGGVTFAGGVSSVVDTFTGKVGTNITGTRKAWRYTERVLP